MTDPTILKVAVNVPLSRLFDYLPPGGTAAIPPGSRVIVPFGRREQIGVVMAQAESSDLPAGKIRHCLATLDGEPLLSAEDLRLITFTSNYYHHPIGEVVAAALPALLRQGKPLFPTLTFVAITDTGAAIDVEELAKRAPRQAELLESVRDAGARLANSSTSTAAPASLIAKKANVGKSGLPCRSIAGRAAATTSPIGW